MRRQVLFIAAAALVTLGGAARAQTALPYVRHKTPLSGRQSPFANAPRPEMLSAEQRLAISTSRWPDMWAAPPVPPGTVLTVPPKPNWLPGPGEYWGPFTNDLGGWGFLVGPNPLPPPPPPTPPSFWWTGVIPQRLLLLTAPTPPPPPPPYPPAMPVAGPVSPDGRMVVTYPDGNQVTWQFPMVEFRGVFQGIGPGGGLFFTDSSGRRFVFGAPFEALVRLNGRPVLRRHVPVGAHVVALARRTNPNWLTLLDFTK